MNYGEGYTNENEAEIWDLFSDPVRCNCCDAYFEKSECVVNHDKTGYFSIECFRKGYIKEFFNLYQGDAEMSDEDVTMYLAGVAILTSKKIINL